MDSASRRQLADRAHHETAETLPALRWLRGSNSRIDSTSSPKKSTRRGADAPGGNRSTMPPRTREFSCLGDHPAAGIAVGGQELDHLLRRQLDPLGQVSSTPVKLSSGGRRCSNAATVVTTSGRRPARCRSRAGQSHRCAGRRCRDGARPGHRAGSPRPEWRRSQSEGAKKPRASISRAMRASSTQTCSIAPARQRGQDPAVESLRRAGQAPPARAGPAQRAERRRAAAPSAFLATLRLRSAESRQPVLAGGAAKLAIRSARDPTRSSPGGARVR